MRGQKNRQFLQQVRDEGANFAECGGLMMFNVALQRRGKECRTAGRCRRQMPGFFFALPPAFEKRNVEISPFREEREEERVNPPSTTKSLARERDNAIRCEIRPWNPPQDQRQLTKGNLEYSRNIWCLSKLCLNCVSTIFQAKM